MVEFGIIIQEGTTGPTRGSVVFRNIIVSRGFKTREEASAKSIKENFASLADRGGASIVELTPEFLAGLNRITKETSGTSRITLQRQRLERERTGETRRERTSRKQSELNRLNTQLRTARGSERQRLLTQRSRVSDVPVSQFTEARQAETRKSPSQLLEREKQVERRKREQRLFGRLEEEAAKEQTRDVRVSTQATVSIGPRLTEATLNLTRGGRVTDFQAQPTTTSLPRDQFTPDGLISAAPPTTLFGKFRKFESGISAKISSSKLFKIREDLVNIQTEALSKRAEEQTGIRRGLTRARILKIGVQEGALGQVIERPLTTAAFIGAGAVVGTVGGLIAATSRIGSVAVKTGGIILGTTFATKTGIDIAGAPTLLEKGEVFGGAAVTATAFGFGAVAGGKFATVLTRPRLVNIDLIAGKVSSVTQTDTGFARRDFNIPFFANIFGRPSAKPKAKPSTDIFETAGPRITAEPPSTFFRASEFPVGATIKTKGGAFAFTNADLAAGFARTRGTPTVREVKSTKFVIDPNIRGAVSRSIPSGSGTKTITSVAPEFILQDVVSEKVIIGKKPTLKEKASIAGTQLTTTVLGADLALPALPSLVLGGTIALGGLPLIPFALAGSTRAISRFQPRKKQAARKSRIIRLEKQQRQIEVRSLFEERIIRRKGKQKLEEIQKFQPFLELRKGPKGSIIQTLTKVPKGQPVRIFTEKGKPLVITEQLGRITIGQKLDVSGKKVIQLGPKRPKAGIGFVALKTLKVSDIPIGKKGFPKGFGIGGKPSGDIDRLVQGTGGLVSVERGVLVPIKRGVSKTKVPRERQPIIRTAIGDPQLDLIKKSPVQEQLPKIAEQPQPLRGGFRPGQREKLVKRIQQREAERRLELELKGQVGVMPGEFGIPEALGQKTQAITDIFSRTKKKKLSFALVEEETFLRGVAPIERQTFATLQTSAVGPARRIRPRRLNVAGDISVGRDLKRESIPKIGFDIGTTTTQVVSSILATGLISSTRQSTELALALTPLSIQSQAVSSVQVVRSDTSQSQRSITDLIQAQVPAQRLLEEPLVPKPPRAPPPPKKPPRLFPPNIPPGKPPRFPPTIGPPRLFPPGLPPTITPPRRPPRLPPLFPRFKKTGVDLKQKDKRKDKRRRFRGTPSLSFILTGRGTQLTAGQIAGTESISPFAIRAIGGRR